MLLLKNFALLLIILSTLIQVTVSAECSTLNDRNKHIYAPLRHCQRSNMTVIGWQNFNAVQKCMEFAKSIKGMAINFSPASRQKKNRFENKTRSWRDEKVADAEEAFFSCQVLQCPEYRNYSTMLNDTRYDYYSLYAFPPRKERINFWARFMVLLTSLCFSLSLNCSPSQYYMRSLGRSVLVRRGTTELHESSQCLSFVRRLIGARSHWNEDEFPVPAGGRPLQGNIQVHRICRPQWNVEFV